MILVILWDFRKLSDPSARLWRPRVKVAAGIKGFGAFQAPGSPFPRAVWLLGSFPGRFQGWGRARLCSAGSQQDREQNPSVLMGSWHLQQPQVTFTSTGEQRGWSCQGVDRGKGRIWAAWRDRIWTFPWVNMGRGLPVHPQTSPICCSFYTPCNS